MLAHVRVLDLTDDRGHLAGLLLAQMGADVIAVEPPGGQRARHRGPYAHDAIGPENSLTHWAYNRGKRSVCLGAGGDDLGALAADADVLIECGALPVDLAALRARLPRLITVSITPFGQTGPKAGWAATDLTVAAASGTVGITGDADRPPVRVSEPQTWGFAAADAACAALLAIRERNRSGRGQHADISAQQAYSTATQFQTMGPLVGKAAGTRLAGGMKLGPVTLQIVHPCADGHVTASFLFGAVFGPYTRRLFQYIHEAGGCDASWPETDWVHFGAALTQNPDALRLMVDGVAIMQQFLAGRAKAELLSAALERNLLIAPITTTADLLGLEQLQARQWWETIDGVAFPGPAAKAPANLTGPLAAAPRLGADSGRIEARQNGAISQVEGNNPLPSDQLPLAGLKVLDFSWALAAPGATRILADHGATVIRVESQSKPDAIRGATPFIGADGELENSLHWHSPNAGKLGLTLNLTRPEARAVVLDLARWADVVVESFSAGTMARFGIDYATLRAVNPGLIMVSSCLTGQTGPLCGYAGFGTAGAALAGFYPLAGWPDRLPAGPFGAYSDYPSPRFTVVALLAALEWRDRTGQGQHIDYAQMEGAMQLIAPALLDQAINQRTASRCGNADPNMAPHGVYPVDGQDRWIAIACETDAHWQALAHLLDRAELAQLDAASRLGRAAHLDELVAAWSQGQDGEDVERNLQAAGIPAHRVLYAEDVVKDPQLTHRGHWIAVDHPLHGSSWAEGSAIQLSRTPGAPRWAGPVFGQHLHEVMSDILGYDDDRIADLLAAGVLE